MIRTAILAALALSCVASSADARPRHHQVAPVLSPECVQNGGRMPCEPPADLRKPIPAGARIVITMHRDRRSENVVPHPSGCPHIAFCGCAASVKLFGHPIKELFLAARWKLFPHAAPAPGMAAVRRDGHHVMVLEEHIEGEVWKVYDGNSGGHLTRVHERSIAGYVIVNPKAT